jgi:kinesin family protein 2/24
MTEEEFRQRCTKTEGVSREQAGAFYSHFWQKYIDTKDDRMGNKRDNGYDEYKESSAVPRTIAKIPFKDRIRPGMFVKYKPSQPTGIKFNLATILCPDWAVETNVKDWKGNEVAGIKGEGARRYLCALVAPAVMNDAFQVSIWRQQVIDVEDMEMEVNLEFDPATRFYFMAI